MGGGTLLPTEDLLFLPTVVTQRLHADCLAIPPISVMDKKRTFSQRSAPSASWRSEKRHKQNALQSASGARPLSLSDLTKASSSRSSPAAKVPTISVTTVVAGDTSTVRVPANLVPPNEPNSAVTSRDGSPDTNPGLGDGIGETNEALPSLESLADRILHDIEERPEHVGVSCDSPSIDVSRG